MTLPRLPLRIGIRIASTAGLAHPAAVQMAARSAEGLGYDAVWVISDDPERLVTVVEAAVAATERIRIGVGLVVGEGGLAAAQRDALPVLHRLACQRLTLGIAIDGVSHSRAEAVVAGILDGWDESVAPRPPLILAADAAEGFELVARRADGWLAVGVPVAELPIRWEALRRLAAVHGRTAALGLVVRAPVALADAPLPPSRVDYHGHVDQVADDILATARAGADEVVLMSARQPELTLDSLLDTCARVAEALEVRTAG